MEIFETMTNKELLLTGLVIFLAVLIFPRLIRQRRITRQILLHKQQGKILTPDDFQGKKKLFYTHNARSSEIEELLAKINVFARRNNMKIVFPGSFRWQGQTSSTTMILTGPFGLLLIHCYGFGGHVYTDPSGQTFFQNMNGKVREIPSPVVSMEQEIMLMRQALEQTAFCSVPIHAASVFTRRGIILSVPEHIHVFSRTEFLTWLKQDSLFTQDNQTEVSALTEYLVKLVRQPEE